MIHSMTGFGDASEQIDGVHYAVEVRSLNNRYFKGTVRLPDDVAGLDAEIESLLRRKLNRGSITLTMRMRRSGEAAAHRINDAALLSYLEHLETIAKRFASTDHPAQINLTEILVLPGVLQPVDTEESTIERVRPIAFRLANAAIAKLMAMRETEGKTIADDLFQQRDVIRNLMEQIAERVPNVVEEYHKRLRSRIDDLLARAELKVETFDLVREVAIFAERSDIAEEVSRLRAHLDQFDQIITANDREPAGRTLDFLSQELLREANTIASKSNDAAISRTIVGVKGAIDRIKEQVQNVE